MAARASASAEAVTVLVFSTTNAAPFDASRRSQPRCISARSMAAPSAWVARQPNFSTRKVVAITAIMAEISRIARLRGLTSVERMIAGLRSRRRVARQPKFWTWKVFVAIADNYGNYVGSPLAETLDFEARLGTCARSVSELYFVSHVQRFWLKLFSTIHFCVLVF